MSDRPEPTVCVFPTMERYIKVIELIDSLLGKWTKGVGRMDTINCPICNGTNTLKYFRSPTNGHVRAKCSTPNCVSFME